MSEGMSNTILAQMRRIACLVFLATGLVLGGESGIDGGAGPSLQEVIDRVRSNEEKLSLIKMKFRADFTSEGDLPDYSHIPRASDRAYKVVREEINWAQDGIRQRFVHRRFAEDNLWLSQIGVVDGEVHKCGDWPELKRGTIADVSTYSRWMVNFAAQLYYRPVCRAPNDWRLLSDVLASPDVMSGGATQKLNDRDVFVVDIRSGTIGCRRLYIDAERGLLLRSDTYSPSPQSEGAKLVGHTELTKVHQTDNGGWVALEGRRIFYGNGYTRFMNVHVDADSISVNRADIPDSLFQLDFPEHTIVTNDILGIGASGKADVIARESLDELYAMEELQQDHNAPDHSSIEESNVPAGPNETQGTRGAFVGEQTVSNDRASTGSSSRHLAWMWGLRQLGLFLLAAGVTIFVLVVRRRGKP